MTIPSHSDGTAEVSLPASGNIHDEIVDFLGANPASHFRQTFNWAASQGFPHIRLFATRRSQQIVAVSFLDTLHSRVPMNTRAQITRGPVFSDDDALDQHLEQLVSLLGHSYVALRVNPFLEDTRTSLPENWSRASDPASYSSTLIVPILATPEAQWRSLRRSTRTSINKSRSAGLLVAAQSEPSDFRSFAQHYNSFARHRGIAPLDENVAANMATSFGTDALLLTARLDGQPVGGTLFMRNAGGFVYEWGWMAPAEDRNKLPIMHRLIWEAIETSRALGLPELDLGGYWRDRGPTDPINHFKRGFTHQKRTYFPEHELVLAPMRFRLLRAARGLVSRIRLAP